MSKTCKHCMYWEIYFKDNFSPAEGVMCRKGYGRTSPDDTCDEFYQNFETEGCLSGGGYYTDDKSEEKLETYYDYLEE